MSSATTQGRPTGGTDETNAAHLALGVLAPLATVALAYGLWFVSDRLLYIAPLDRAAFGWAVVVPVWALAPVAAAFAWRRLTPRGITMAAAALGLIVGGLAAGLLWSAFAFPNCQFGAIRSPIELVPPSVIVGLVIGTGLSAAGLLSATLLRGGHPWLASAAGAGSGLALVFVALFAAAVVLLGPSCQRPPLG
jgi:hypothetical protein